jgi:excinuclease ABC subunit A
MDVVQKLVDRGNSVIIIEHNLDVIKLADHIIDMGLEGGKRGGELLAVGTPEEIAAVNHSYTAEFLRPLLDHHK